MKQNAIRFLLLAAAVAGMLHVVGYWDPPVIRVSNATAVELRDVTLTGRGFVEKIPRIAPGQSAEVVAHPAGESSLTVAFVAAGQAVRADADTYFEGLGGYRVQVDVAPGFGVSVRARAGN